MWGQAILINVDCALPGSMGCITPGLLPKYGGSIPPLGPCTVLSEVMDQLCHGATFRPLRLAHDPETFAALIAADHTAFAGLCIAALIHAQWAMLTRFTLGAGVFFNGFAWFAVGAPILSEDDLGYLDSDHVVQAQSILATLACQIVLMVAAGLPYERRSYECRSWLVGCG